MSSSSIFEPSTMSTVTEGVDYLESPSEYLNEMVTPSLSEMEDIVINAPTILLIISLSLIILGTIFGNVLTLTALFKHRPLQTPPNYLIASLAVADLMVAILVMPLSLTKQVVVIWMFGPILCDAWISLDVLCCTASILSLCMISLDRFWAITKPVQYRKHRNAKTMFILIAVVWFVSSLISTSPLFGWRGKQAINTQTCKISQDKAFTIFSTFGAFFIPMTIMMIVYARIFCEARKRIRGKTFHGLGPTSQGHTENNVRHLRSELQSCQIVISDPVTENGIGENYTTLLSQNELAKSVPNLQNGGNEESERKKQTFVTSLTVPGQKETTFVSLSADEINANKIPSNQRLLPCPSPLPSQLLERERKRRATATAREHRATKTLGIVTGAFLICWLPFFLAALILPLCEDSCSLPMAWESIFLWLGYFNSMLNPIIYTKFNRDFQKAFKKLLRCNKNKH